LKLYRLKKKINLVFNVAEGLHGRDRESHIPAMLEMLQIPYVGCSPLTQALILDKAKTKEILIAHKIPTLPFQVFYSAQERLQRRLHFPLIVKPLSQGSSAGITNKSVVYTKKDLEKQIKYILDSFNEAVLVERYLEGREFSIAMYGYPPKILPIIEADHSLLPKKFLPFDSIEVKWYYEIESNANHLICPAKIGQIMEKKLKTICKNTWYALQIQDWCRIDIRCDKKENPYVLEVNSPPGCTPEEHDPASYFPLASRAANLKYIEVLEFIIQSARERYGI
jgi:D-alanine-D-alanine ligase